MVPTLPVLLAFRVLQGLGGALVLANVMAEITAVFPPQQRRLAMGLNASILALAHEVAAGLALVGMLLSALRGEDPRHVAAPPASVRAR